MLVLDDDEVLQKLLNAYLGQQGYQIHSLFEGELLSDFLEKNHVDLVILDLVLPGRNGLDWLTWLKHKRPHLPVIILSAEQTVEMRIATLSAGAVDYLAKPFHPTELLLRIKNILRVHHAPLNTSKLADYQYCFDAERALFFRHNITIKLTTTETLLLKFFFEHVGEVVSRDAISETLRGSRHHPLDRSIDVHINRLRKKIEERPSLPKYLNTVWGKGYRFIPPKKPNPDPTV
nr:response regulator transcription factor [Thiolinea disciformis]